MVVRFKSRGVGSERRLVAAKPFITPPWDPKWAELMGPMCTDFFKVFPWTHLFWVLESMKMTAARCQGGKYTYNTFTVETCANVCICFAERCLFTMLRSNRCQHMIPDRNKRDGPERTLILPDC